MMKKILKTFALCAMLFAVSGINANAQRANAHQKHHKNLIAKQSNVKDQIQILDKNSAMGHFKYEDLEPEPDIYTEGWNSRFVNPFKESDVPAQANIDVRNFAMPCPGFITSPYGYRKRFGRMHKGVDLAIRMNDTIYAAFDGKVRLTNYEGKGYGNYVIMRHPNGLETVYGHLNKFLVKKDQYVKAGQPIALGGSTGRSTGPHLHFETRFRGYAINPQGIFDFANHTTHTDTYHFSKTTYQNARNYAPKKRNDGQPAYQANNNRAATYTVRKGDSLAAIAQKNGISVTTLRKLNHLSPNQNIKVGQTLKVK